MHYKLFFHLKLVSLRIRSRIFNFQLMDMVSYISEMIFSVLQTHFCMRWIFFTPIINDTTFSKNTQIKDRTTRHVTSSIPWMEVIKKPLSIIKWDPKISYSIKILMIHGRIQAGKNILLLFCRNEVVRARRKFLIYFHEAEMEGWNVARNF